MSGPRCASAKQFRTNCKIAIMFYQRFGVGKKGMEAICLEELGYVNEEIRKRIEKPYDIQVSLRCYTLR